MIIKKLAKLVKKTHYLGITSTTNEQSQQWLGGNWGLYDISDLPSITYEQACAMFDFSAKTIDKTWDDNDGAWILAKRLKRPANSEDLKPTKSKYTPHSSEMKR